MTDIPELFADFNNTDQHGRVRLNTNGTFASIRQANLELKEGMQVLLKDNDSLTTIGYVRYSDKEMIWVAEINWAEIKTTSRNRIERVIHEWYSR